MNEERERLVDQYQTVSAATDTTWPEVKAHAEEVIQHVLLAVTALGTTLGP